MAETFSLYDSLVAIHIQGRLISLPDIISRQVTKIKHEDDPKLSIQQSSLVLAFNDLPYGVAIPSKELNLLMSYHYGAKLFGLSADRPYISKVDPNQYRLIMQK